MEQQQFKYFAFISYNSKDTEWGKRVQRKLEHYRMPATLCSEHGWERTPIKPVFFAPTDIQPGGLTEELQERLRASRNLIVICSPNSAKSEWVGKEIEFFHQLGRTKQIHFFIVEGQPQSGNPDTDCFNPIIDTLRLPEILGANIHEKIYRWPWMNKERAYVQLVSKLLGVEFDAIWQRHKRLLVRKVVTWAIGVIAVVAALIGVWMTNQPVDVEVRLNEVSVHNPHLPVLKDAVITMTLDNESKSDTIATIHQQACFNNVPHRFLGEKVHIYAACQYFLPVDTIVVLNQTVALDIRRDEAVFGEVHFQLYDQAKEAFIPHVVVNALGQQFESDADGQVRFFVPLEQQRPSYRITPSVPLKDSTVVMPCNIGSIPTLIKK